MLHKEWIDDVGAEVALLSGDEGIEFSYKPPTYTEAEAQHIWLGEESCRALYKNMVKRSRAPMLVVTLHDCEGKPIEAYTNEANVVIVFRYNVDEGTRRIIIAIDELMPIIENVFDIKDQKWENEK